MIAVAAGEARDPERAIVRAFRSTMLRLALFYLGSLAVMLAVLPWTQAGTATSPFVTVMAASGLPYAAGVINAVVLVAALSAMNSQLYTASRMLFSLADSGLAPRRLGVVDARGWGYADDSFHCLEGMATYGREAWFGLGDRDIATHLHRTMMVREGATVALLGFVGVSPADAVAMSVAYGIVLIVVGIPGGLLWLRGQKSTQRPARSQSP